MQRLVHALLALLLLLGLARFETSAAAQTDDLLDLSDVPLPVQALPEAGYQILNGGYLSPNEVASLIADPRNLDVETTSEQIADFGITRTYVLDLVLPEDRAWQDSPAIAVIQTSVYLVDEAASPEQLAELLTNHSNSEFVEQRDPAVEGAETVAIVGSGGDQLRSVITDERVVLEIVTLDATGAPDETGHILIVEATLERLQNLRQSGEFGLGPRALTLLPGPETSVFAHNNQTGTHGLYRYRDAGVQPALGELDIDDAAVAPGMRSLYLGSQAAETGGGVALVSVWLGEFDSDSSASTFFEMLVSGSPAGSLIDPFFTITVDESWSEQGVLGVYRVSGTWGGERYSGNVEIRQYDRFVVAIGYRSVGALLPAADITSSIMDHQLGCIESEQACGPFDLTVAMPPPQATPIPGADNLGSVEFGWSLPEFGPDWTVTEQFNDQGYDRIGVRNGLSIFEIESVINHHGEPVQCVLDELHLLEEFEEHSVISVWEDAAGNTDGGNTETQAWITYRVEPLSEERADQEYVIRIDCFTLVPGSANLVVTHISPIDFWLEEAPKGDYLRDGIVLPELSGMHGKLFISAHDRRTPMILILVTDNAA